MTTFSVGTRVQLTALPGTLARFGTRIGEVRAVDGYTVDVLFEDEQEVVAIIPAYLAAVRGKPARRSPLTLRAPRDTRTEAQRMADGLGEIERLGYIVLRVGQGRAAAICHKCSRNSRARGGSSFVQIHCADCGSLGYAPHTNSTSGVPDSLVTHRNWPRGGFLGLEWKDGPNGKRQEEQSVLEGLGRIVVVHDTPSALSAVVEFERGLGITTLADIEALRKA